ncbi:MULTISPECIES: EpsG family protein [Acinetobacter calcoaceticus/baumannii complex]|nr:EpsG family protein [Acinetobacter baumannii]
MLLLSLALILFPFAFLDNAFNNQYKRLIIWFFCSLFVVLGGIKWNTGTDWNAYYYNFLNSVTYDRAVNSPTSFEWGYSTLNYLINSLTGSFTVFLLIFSFITIYLKYKVLINRQFISYGLFGLFCFYCYTMGDIISWRQAFAISLILFSIFFIIKRDFLPFLLCIVIASLFHRSAVICLLIYYAYNLNISKKNMLLIFIASMFLGLFLFKFKVSNLNIPFLSGLELFSAYQEKLDAYNDIGQVSYGQVDSTLSNFLGYLRKAIFVIPMILLVKKDNKIIYGLMNISLIGSVIYFVLGAIASDFKRLGGYFDIFDIILVPAILYGIESKKVRYFLIFIYALFMLLRLYASIYNFWDIYDPFITIFDFHSTRNLY